MGGGAQQRLPRSATEDIVFPGIPGLASTRLLGMQYQFEQISRWPRAAIERQQLRQLTALLAHCRINVPFLRDRISRAGIRPEAELTLEAWRDLPPLTRREVQEAGPALFALRVPETHGRIMDWATSGSTGTPVTGRKTEIAQFIWMAITLRQALWHNFDLSGKLAVIRRDSSGSPRAEGRRQADWGPSIALVYPTGPAVQLDVRTSVVEQVAWLQRERPTQLASFPGIITLLARHCIDHGIALPGMQTVQTFGETVTDEVRLLARQAWGAPVCDAYSAEDAGFIALQCPEHETYHVQSEAMLVEVLRADGTDCAPGETGRVVVTSLHNFAMPLLRYEIGDDAEVGPPCPCGRGLQVLNRIAGRSRGRVLLPDGTWRPAFFGAHAFAQITAVRQFQFAQIAPDMIEIRIVANRVLTIDEEAILTAAVHNNVSAALRVRFAYVTAIAALPSGKFEPFRCEIAPL